MLERVKTLLGIDISDLSKDALLTILIEDAQAEVVEFCHLSEYNIKFNSVASKMVVIAYNRLGQEGITSQSYSGASETYTEGYPEDIMSVLRVNRKVKIL